jgi:hypothetical protein
MDRHTTNGRVTDHAPTQNIFPAIGEFRFLPLSIDVRGTSHRLWRGGRGVRSVGTKNSLSLPSGTPISNSKPLPTTAILPSCAITVGSVATQNRTYCHLVPSALGSPAIRNFKTKTPSSTCSEKGGRREANLSGCYRKWLETKPFGDLRCNQP